MGCFSATLTAPLLPSSRFSANRFCLVLGEGIAATVYSLGVSAELYLPRRPSRPAANMLRLPQGTFADLANPSRVILRRLAKV